MVELRGESVLFLRVRPGQVDRAVKELAKDPRVRKAEAIIGTYDVAVAGAFRNLDDLQKFASEAEMKDYCEACTAHPGFAEWKNEQDDEPATAWTLIRAANAPKAADELKRVSSVKKLFSTTGEFNIVARLTAKDPAELQRIILRDLHKVPGVRRTETRPSLSKER